MTDVLKRYFQAIRKNDIATITQLLKRKAIHIDQTFPSNGSTGLIEAVRYGNTKTVRFFLEQGARTDLRAHDDGTALHWAAISNSKAKTQLLIDHDANIHASSVFGNTPLIVAASTGSTATVRLLLQHGAQPHHMNSQKESAMSCALKNKHRDTFRVLYRWHCRQTKAYVEDDFLKNKTLDDLRSTENGVTLMCKAALADRFDAVIDHLASTNEISRITIEDLFAKDRNGNNVLEILGARKKLDQAFDKRIWNHLSKENLDQALGCLPPVYKKQVNADSLNALFNHQRLRRTRTRRPGL